MEMSKRVKRKEKRAEPTEARTYEMAAESRFVSELTALLMRAAEDAEIKLEL